MTRPTEGPAERLSRLLDSGREEPGGLFDFDFYYGWAGDLHRLIETARSPLHVEAPAMLEVLKALSEWAAQTGEWEAPCWLEARAIIARIEGKERG